MSGRRGKTPARAASTSCSRPDNADDGAGGVHCPALAGTNEGYALLRSILEERQCGGRRAGRSPTRKRIGLLSALTGERASTSATFVDAIDVVFDSTIPYDIRFFQSLDRIVQHEPWLDRDKAMIDVLRTLGIEKGKEFRPDVDRRMLLGAAALEAHDSLDARFEASLAPYYEGAHWSLALPAGARRDRGVRLREDGRVLRRRARRRRQLFVQHGEERRHGTGLPPHDRRRRRQAARRLECLPSPRAAERSGEAVLVRRRLRPRDARADAQHRAAEPLPRSRRSWRRSPTDPSRLVFAPAAPTEDANWIPTSAGEQFEVMFRFYGPEPAFLDKSWRLPDIELL